MTNCEKCGEELTDEDEADNICNKCLEGEVYSYCANCGRKLEDCDGAYLCPDCSDETEQEA